MGAFRPLIAVCLVSVLVLISGHVPGDVRSEQAVNHAGTTVEDSDYGGFVRPSRILDSDFECTIATVNAEDITYKQFLKRFHGKKPVMIRGGVKHWSAQQMFTKEFLRRAVPEEAHYLSGQTLRSKVENTSSDGAEPTESDKRYMFVDMPGGRFRKTEAVINFGFDGEGANFANQMREPLVPHDHGEGGSEPDELNLWKYIDMPAVMKNEYTDNFSCSEAKAKRMLLEQQQQQQQQELEQVDVAADGSSASSALSQRNTTGAEISFVGKCPTQGVDARIFMVFFGLGDGNRGLHFHRHGAAASGLVWGRKLWFVMDPDFPLEYQMHYWSTHPRGLEEPGYAEKSKNFTYPLYNDDDTLEQIMQIKENTPKKHHPLQCIQNKGDLL